ncbi:MAG: hypothetical protein WC707_00730 [Candidatus Babeliaceae bacterium]|jgi:hypothetical protein
MKLVFNIILLLSIVSAQAMQLTRVGRMSQVVGKNSMHSRSFCTQSPVQFLHKHFEELIASPIKRAEFKKAFINFNELDKKTVKDLFVFHKNSYLQEKNKEIAEIKNLTINQRILCGVGSLASFSLVSPSARLADEVAGKCADFTDSDIIGVSVFFPMFFGITAPLGLVCLRLAVAVIDGEPLDGGVDYHRKRLFEKQSAIQELSDIMETKE